MTAVGRNAGTRLGAQVARGTPQFAIDDLDPAQESGQTTGACRSIQWGHPFCRTALVPDGSPTPATLIGDLNTLQSAWLGSSLVSAHIDRAAPARAGQGHTATVSAHYRAPAWFTRNVFNRAVASLTRHGVSVLGSRVLVVRGRTSGVWRTTPVNLLNHDGRRYLVSARGEGQWVRNLRAARTGELRVGRRSEAFRGRELSDEEKVPVLRAYLKRWKVEVRAFFDGVGPNSSDAQIQAIAGKHPVFEVLPAD